jgi:hypothetical protein
MSDDHINIFFSEQDDGYIADIPLARRSEPQRRKLLPRSNGLAKSGLRRPERDASRFPRLATSL